MTRPLALEHGFPNLRERPTRAVHRRRGWLVRRVLLAADLLGLTAAFVFAELVFGPGSGPQNTFGIEAEALLFAAGLPCWALLARAHGLYGRDEQRADHSTCDDFWGVFHLVTICTWLVVTVALVSGLANVGIRMFVFWAAAIAFVVVARAAARTLARRHWAYIQNAVIVGTDSIAELLGRKLLQHPEYGIALVGFAGVAPDEAARRSEVAHVPILGAPEELDAIVSEYDVERVIFAFPDMADDELAAAIHALRRRAVQVDVVPRLFGVMGSNVDVHSVEGVELIGLQPAPVGRCSRLLKRALDIAIAGAALVVTAPAFAYIAWRIRRDSHGPVFFRQTRLGLNMRRFTVLKFRTMTVGENDAEHRAHVAAVMDPNAAPSPNGLYKLDRSDRVTRVGRWLRKTSLDELPQLINVVRGDMSLVGPRPCIPYETEHFEEHHFDRFRVPAGITGLWQVKARARCTFAEALDLDVAYANAWSVGLDLRLLFQTPLQIFRSRTTA